METRLEHFIKSLAHKDEEGKMTFPFNEKHTFFANGNDHLVSLPVAGCVDIDCDVRDDTIVIHYRLLEVTRDTDGMLDVIYIFNPDRD